MTTQTITDLITVTRDKDGKVSMIHVRKPSDFHCHLRLGALRDAVSPAVTWPYKYVLVMPNTKPHLLTVEDALQYKEDVEKLLRQHDINTIIIPTIYLTAATTPETIDAIADLSGSTPMAVKSYPPGGTTNSDEAADLRTMGATLKRMEARGVRLLIHGECVHDAYNNTIPFPNREDYFMEHVFPRAREEHPDLMICLEHVTTEKAVTLVKQDATGNTVCTITPQHMVLTAQAFEEPWGGVHARCMPYLKSEEERYAVADFATSGDPRAILGTDCAPHLSKAKNMPFEEAACGCYTPHALGMYAEVFEQFGRLEDHFAHFASLNGPRWWGLPEPKLYEQVVLSDGFIDAIPSPTKVPAENDIVVPLGWTSDPRERMPLSLAAQMAHG